MILDTFLNCKAKFWTNNLLLFQNQNTQKMVNCLIGYLGLIFKFVNNTENFNIHARILTFVIICMSYIQILLVFRVVL